MEGRGSLGDGRAGGWARRGGPGRAGPGWAASRVLVSVVDPEAHYTKLHNVVGSFGFGFGFVDGMCYCFVAEYCCVNVPAFCLPPVVCVP